MRGGRGFTLLEVLVAVAIFSGIAVFALAILADSAWLATRASVARELRMLAEHKLGEVLVFENEYDQSAVLDGDFRELGDRYADWKWRVEVRDVTVFGTSTDENAEYLFDDPAEDELATQQEPPSGTGSGTEQKGETQILREIVLVVTSRGDDGEPDTVEIVTYMPLVPQTAGGKQ